MAAKAVITHADGANAVLSGQAASSNDVLEGLPRIPVGLSLLLPATGASTDMIGGG